MGAAEGSSGGDAPEVRSELQRGRDRRRPRAPEVIHMFELLGRTVEWAIVVVVAMVTTWATFERFELGGARDYVQAIWLGSVVFAAASEFAGAHDPDARFSLRNGMVRVSTAWAGSCVFLVLIAFLFRVSDEFSRLWASTTFASVWLCLLIARISATLALRRIKRTGIFDQRLAIFGNSQQRQRLLASLGARDEVMVEVTGCYGPSPTHEATSEPFRGGAERLLADAREGRVDQVIITLPFSEQSVCRELVRELSTMPVLIRLFPDMGGFTFTGQALVVLGGVPLATLFEKPINGSDVIWKRFEDILIGAILLIFASPAILVSAFAIKLESPGPVFFRQRRDGFNNRSFRIWKLRTMYADTSQYESIEQAKRGDQRITRVGRFLRASSLDELPQFINVILGDMSLVGPRPHAPSTRVNGILFHEAVKNYAARHRVKPGLTGWAQVNGWRGETDTEEKLQKRLELDLFYIEHWSVAFDLYIIGRTVGALVFPRRAY